MSAIVSKATGLVNTAVAKSTQLANCAVYWAKVGAELGKTVYKAEGMAPPSQAEFKLVYNACLKFVQSPKEQKALLEKIAALKPSKELAVKSAVYGVQGLAFFSVGEIIGRRHVFGYPSTGAHH